MILIQVILIAAFMYLLARFLSNPVSYRMQAWQKIMTILFFLLAVFAVLFSEKLNDIAHFVGVGRGADLMLYLLILAFIYTLFSTYVKEAHDRRRAVRLVRAIALTEAKQSNHNKLLLKKLQKKSS